MNVGPVRAGLAAGAVVLVATVAVVAALAPRPVASAMAVAAIICVLGAIALVQYRQGQRSARKLDVLRKQMAALRATVDEPAERLTKRDTRRLVGEVERRLAPTLSGLTSSVEELRTSHVASSGVPQAHFEQLTRLISSNMVRVEAAVDDLSQRVARAERGSSVNEVDADPARSNGTRKAETAVETRREAGYDDFYEVPVFRHEVVDAMDLSGPTRAIHEVVVSDRLTLPAYLDQRPGDVLWVTFHGALTKGVRYPKFERVRTVAGLDAPCLAFADPTVTLTSALTLGWYQGTVDVDLLDPVVDMIRQVQGSVGAARVVLLGGSGGGHMALRVSTRLRDSLAFVYSPQTDIRRYHPTMSAKFYDAVTGGLPESEAQEALSGRLSVVDQYAAQRPANWIYYFQNANDPHHLEHHFTPFAQVHGVGSEGGVSDDGRRVFVLGDSTPGHGAPTTSEFARHLQEALSVWQGATPSASP